MLITSTMADPRMSMSGRLSTDINSPLWGGGGVTGYSADGRLPSATHGRRSHLYQQQNGTLYNSFGAGEESVGLTDLTEGDESDEEGRGRDSGGRRDTKSLPRLTTDYDLGRR